MAEVSRRSFLVGSAGLLAAGALPVLAKPQAAAASPAKAKAAAARTFELDRFIADVKQARTESDSQAAVQELVARAVSEPASVLRELGEPTEGGITVLYKDDTVTISKVVWTPLMVLVPHNHLMWAVIGIYTGREDNILWKPSGPTIEAATAASLSPKEVLPLPDTVIHSVTNPINKLTGAIHVYGGDLTAVQRSQWDAETLREKPFDFEKVRKYFQEANARLKDRG
jgi:predicted metal-dependent enzyme (double-stranded beta helix superfamily)